MSALCCSIHQHHHYHHQRIEDYLLPSKNVLRRIQLLTPIRMRSEVNYWSFHFREEILTGDTLLLKKQFKSSMIFDLSTTTGQIKNYYRAYHSLHWKRRSTNTGQLFHFYETQMLIRLKNTQANLEDDVAAN